MLSVVDESRVLANFKPSFDGVSTIAHELGHGYHNLQLADRPILHKQWREYSVTCTCRDDLADAGRRLMPCWLLVPNTGACC